MSSGSGSQSTPGMEITYPLIATSVILIPLNHATALTLNEKYNQPHLDNAPN